MKWGRTPTKAPTPEAVRAALSGIALPGGGSLGDAGRLDDIAVAAETVTVAIAIAPEEAAAFEEVRKAAQAAVRAMPGVGKALAVLTAHRASAGAAPSRPRAHVHTHSRKDRAAEASAPKGAGPLAGIAQVRQLVAVASGKGGVGKSTLAVNLAVALAGLGKSVGLLDADIYGPSVPRLVGVHEKPEAGGAQGRLKPLEAHGLKLMSMGFLVAEESPMIWRGPMVQSAIVQMLRDVDWGALDILVIDMPPGTGDAQLTLAQQAPLAGAVIVSTPQDIALIDARKAIAMFEKVRVPILGVVENMSHFVCPCCGERSEIFGHGGARTEAETRGVPFLGEVPLHAEIRIRSDEGMPVGSSGTFAEAFAGIAQRVIDALEATGRPAPRMVVQ